MKKYLMLFILLFLPSCTLNKNKEEKSDEKKFDDSYIEVVPDSAVKFISLINDDRLILTSEEIASYNAKMYEKTDKLYNIDNISNLDREKIKEYIESYKVPSLPKYNNEEIVTSEMIKEMQNNRNLEALPNSISYQKGIIVKRTNMKSFPTDIHLYESRGEDNFDSLQETELHVNTPVIILHESADKKWKFVISKTYYGWVLSDDIAYASDEEYDFFTNNSSFGIITSSSIEINDTVLDMSTSLPYLGVNEEGYRFALPRKNDEGNVQREEIIISRDKAHIGYLPFTKRNIYIEAFKYEGVDYRWGGMDYGVDCSSYIANVLRTFGLEIPRNTSDQRVAYANIIDLTGMNNEEKLNVLKENYPSLIYQPGHVMLYLGKLDEINYIIHASGSELKVAVTVLDNSSYLNKIDRLVPLI